MLDTILEGRFVFGISPGGLPSDWEVFGNLDLDRREKFLECIDHVVGLWTGEPPYDLVGKHWSISTARTMIPEIGQGAMVQPLPAAASADRRHRRGAELAERGRGRAPRLGHHLCQLPASPLGANALGHLCRGGRTTGPGRSVHVAGGEDGARGRRRSHGSRVRVRPAEPVPALLRPAGLQARPRGARQPLQGRCRASRLGGHDRLDRRPARDRRDGRTRSSRSYLPFARRSATSAPCSTAGSTGSTLGSPAARWS